MTRGTWPSPLQLCTLLTAACGLRVQALFPEKAGCMSPRSLYVVEDTHTMDMPAFTTHPSQIWRLFGEAIWASNHPGNFTADGLARKSQVQPHPVYGRMVSAVHSYQDITFITRAERGPLASVIRGSSSIPYGEGANHKYKNLDKQRAHERAQAEPIELSPLWRQEELGV